MPQQITDPDALAILGSVQSKPAPASTSGITDPDALDVLSSAKEAPASAVPAPGTSPAAPSRSLGRQIVDSFANAGGNVVKGAGSLIDLPIDALNAGVKHFGGPANYFQTIHGLTDKGLGAAGVQPDNSALGQTVGAIEQGVGGLATGMGAGAALKSSASPVAQGVGKALSSHPGAALAAVTTGSAAQDIARQNGVGPVGQFLWSMAGGLVPSGLESAASGASALVAPFTKSGQQQIIASALRRFGEGGNLKATPSQIEGVQPTLPEATGNAGFASLQRYLSGLDGNANLFDQRQLANNGQRVAAMRNAFGDQNSINAAMEAREQGTAGLYDLASTLDQVRSRDARSLTQDATQDAAAKAEAANQAAIEEAKRQRLVSLGSDVPEPQLVTPPVYGLQPTPALKALASRPAMQSAMAQAKQIAANEGVSLGDPMMSIRGIQYTKMALDQMLNANPMQSLGKFDKAAVAGIKNQLMQEAEKISPEYATANSEFARLSKPINAMQVGQEILSKGATPTLDALENPTLQPNAFARAVNNADDIAQSVTGYKGATAANTLSPDQVATIQRVKADLERYKIGQNAGKAVGSNSVQNLASDHLLSTLGGMFGVSNAHDLPVLRNLSGAMSSAFKLAGIPNELRDGLTRVVLDPMSPESQAVLSRLTAPQRRVFTSTIAPYIPQAVQASQSGLQQPQVKALGR